MAAADIETTAEVVVDPPPFTIDPPPFPVSVPATVPPTPADIEATKQFLMVQRDALTNQVVQIEILLGFIASADDLAVRIARVERFLGI